MIGCSILRSFNKTLSFINFIFVLAATGVLAAQDTSSTVSGEIRDIAGASIPVTNVELKLQDSPGTVFSVRADQEGKFRFSVLPPGMYTLTLKQPGFNTMTVKSIRLAEGEQKTLPLLRLDVGFCGGLPSPNFLELIPGEQHVGNLRGHILREQKHYPGPPIAHAIVTLLCRDGKVCGETKTDVNGEFLFFNLPAGDDFTIRVTHPGFYLLDDMNYVVRAGFESTFWPISLEHCPNGNCDPRLRPKKPLGLCE
jgi:hypothetical protein